MRIKKIVVIIIGTALISLVLPIKNCYAIVQSNKLTHASPTYTNWTAWMTNMRTVESGTGAMGLSETYNSSTLAPTTPENDVDVHLMKNTEYGALVLLSASAYGTFDKSNAKPETTTGNNTGVYMNYSSYQYTSGVLSGIASYQSKYINQYGNAKVGDATTEIGTWNTWRKNTALPRTQTLTYGYQEYASGGGYSSYGNCTVNRTFCIRGYSYFADSCFVSDQTFSIRFGRYSSHPKTAVINYWHSLQPTTYIHYGTNEGAYETYNFYLGTPNYMGRGVAIFL